MISLENVWNASPDTLSKTISVDFSFKGVLPTMKQQEPVSNAETTSFPAKMAIVARQLTLTAFPTPIVSVQLAEKVTTSIV